MNWNLEERKGKVVDWLVFLDMVVLVTTLGKGSYSGLDYSPYGR